MTPHKCRVPGLNIGCTSFIIPDYYVPAVRELLAERKRRRLKIAN